MAPSPPPPGIPEKLWNTGALPAPKGVTPNFDHPENKDREIIVLNSVFLALMLLAVALRFAFHHPRSKSFNWDAAMCLLAAAGSVCHSAIMISSLHMGYGKHFWEIRAITMTRAKLLHMNQLSTLYIITVFFAKLAVLLLYLRIFEIMTVTSRLIWVGIGFTVASMVAFIGVEIGQATQCVKIDGFIHSPFCAQMPNIVVTQAAWNVFLDFYILVIPIQQVLKLELPSRNKLGVAALFGIGFLACIASAVRLGFTIKNMHEVDALWSAVITSELSVVEMNVVIIAPCLLFLPAFIHKSKSNLSSIRSRFLSRSRLDESKNSSLRNGGSVGKDGSAIRVNERRSFDIEFITKPDDQSSDSNTPTSTYQVPKHANPIPQDVV